MTMNEKKLQRQQELIDIMLQYKDEHGNIDLSRLRKEDNKTYNKISYNFGSIDEALIACNANGLETNNIAAKGAPLNRKTLRNELAYDMLSELRKNNTLEEIAERYGCTRAHVNQLFQSLTASVGEIRKSEENENSSVQ